MEAAGWQRALARMDSNVQGDASGRAGPVGMTQHGTQGSSFRRNQVFGFMLCFHLLENFSDLGAGEMDQLYKHEDRVLSSTHMKKPGVG